jgi:folate-binding protein YgfZ
VSNETPLHAAAAKRGARFCDDAGWDVPAAFGDLAGELAAVYERAGVADVSHWGHFWLTGKESVRFLQGLTTNDVARLAPGGGRYSAFLNVHGRIEADCHVFAFEDGLLLQTPPEATEWVWRSLGRFNLAGGFKLERFDGTRAALTVQGPRGPEALGAALGAEVGDLAPLTCRAVDGPFGALKLVGVRRTLGWGADVVGPTDGVARLWDALVESHGVVPVGVEALDVLRMEAGVPRFGRDFGPDTVLQEVDVPEIVSFDKGCYLGQEIVARIHFQGQPSKLLRRLDLGNGPLPVPGDALVAADGDPEKPVGTVTSAAVSPALGPVVFAVVKRKHYAPGTPVRVRSGDGFVAATVRERRSQPAVGSAS